MLNTVQKRKPKEKTMPNIQKTFSNIPYKPPLRMELDMDIVGIARVFDAKIAAQAERARPDLENLAKGLKVTVCPNKKSNGLTILVQQSSILFTKTKNRFVNLLIRFLNLFAPCAEEEVSIGGNDVGKSLVLELQRKRQNLGSYG